MSAFLCDDSVFNQVVSTLAYGKGKYQSKFSESGAIKAFEKIDYFFPEDFEKLATDLFKLNSEAVGARYGDRVTALPFTVEISRSNVRPVMVAYKLAQCLSYQCCEGDINKRPLYKALESLINFFANDIAMSHADYEDAPWG